MATSKENTDVVPPENHSKIKVHEDTNFPDKAWVKLKKGIKVVPVHKLPLNTQVFKNKVKIYFTYLKQILFKAYIFKRSELFVYLILTIILMI